MVHEKQTNKLSTNKKRARLAVEGTNLYAEIYLLGFKLACSASRSVRYRARRVGVNMVREFKIHQTAFVLITRQHRKINEKIKLSVLATNHSNSMKLHVSIKRNVSR